MALHPTGEHELLDAARAGDERAYGRLLEPYRRELQAHCYRMLGSVHDAEDALQEASLRAWRGLQRFEGRSSLRSWLYTIATNTCLNHIERRPNRVLPVDYGPAADPHDQFALGLPLAETVWMDPFATDENYEQQEALELAFIAALQHLPPNQRAVLVLREVLGFSAKEVAGTLDTTVASVNSAMQRARKTIDDKLPEQSQQETLRALGDERLRELVEDYMDAMRNADVDKVVSLLAEDVAWSMPPVAAWFLGRDGVENFLRGGPLSGMWRWRHVPVTANGQPAVGSYAWTESEDAYRPFALDVLSLAPDGRIRGVTSFIVRSRASEDLDFFLDWPKAPLDPEAFGGIFGRLGLPERLD